MSAEAGRRPWWALVLAGLFMLESLGSGVWMASLAPTFAWRDGLSVAAILARGVVGALQFMTAWVIVRAAPPWRTFARTVLVASAALTTASVGFALVPMNLDPAWRWPLVAASWLWAGGWLWLLRTPKA